MKKAFLIGLLLLTHFAFARDLLSSEVITKAEESAPMPSDLSFTSHHIRVLNESWFISLFNPSCEAAFQPDLDQPVIELRSFGSESILLKINGQIAEEFSLGKATYIPVYYANGRAIHPHFRVKLPGWLTLHLQIHRSGQSKQLTVSVLVGQGQNTRVIPVFESTGF